VAEHRFCSFGFEEKQKRTQMCEGGYGYHQRGNGMEREDWKGRYQAAKIPGTGEQAKRKHGTGENRRGLGTLMVFGQFDDLSGSGQDRKSHFGLTWHALTYSTTGARRQMGQEFLVNNHLRKQPSW